MRNVTFLNKRSEKVNSNYIFFFNTCRKFEINVDTHRPKKPAMMRNLCGHLTDGLGWPGSVDRLRLQQRQQLKMRAPNRVTISQMTGIPAQKIKDCRETTCKFGLNDIQSDLRFGFYKFMNFTIFQSV